MRDGLTDLIGKKYTETLDVDGDRKDWHINHKIGTFSVVAQVFNLAGGFRFFAHSKDTVILYADKAPAAGEIIKVVVIG